MLRYQQQFGFFDARRSAATIRFVHLGKEMIQGGLTRSSRESSKRSTPPTLGIVVVDSFRSVARLASGHGRDDQMDLERFVQLLALHAHDLRSDDISRRRVPEQETNSNPVFTVRGRHLWLYRTVVRNRPCGGCRC